MPPSDANAIYQKFTSSKQVELKREVETLAITYAHHRARWALGSVEERREMDAARTAAHNAFIDACNILGRAMARSGEDSSWRAALGDDRKAMGDFACYIHCQLAISAR